MSKISSIEILSKNAFENCVTKKYDFQTFHEITKLNTLREKNFREKYLSNYL